MISPSLLGALTLAVHQGAVAEDATQSANSSSAVVLEEVIVTAQNQNNNYVAQPYQPGGANLALPGVPPTVGSSTLTNYELGVKTFLDQHRLVGGPRGLLHRLEKDPGQRDEWREMLSTRRELLSGSRL